MEDIKSKQKISVLDGLTINDVSVINSLLSSLESELKSLSEDNIKVNEEYRTNFLEIIERFDVFSFAKILYEKTEDFSLWSPEKITRFKELCRKYNFEEFEDKHCDFIYPSVKNGESIISYVDFKKGFITREEVKKDE